MNVQQAKALQQIAKAVVSACETLAPGGVIYAALMGKGCSLNQYQQIMAMLVQAGMVERDGECYTATDKGRTFAAL